MQKKINILGDMIESFIAVHNSETLVRRTARLMYDNFRSACVEIAWGIGASTRVYSATRDGDTFALRVTDRDINQSAFGEVINTGQALVSDLREETDEKLFMEERKGIELYASQLLILPLYEADDINGFVSIYLLEEQDLGALSELFQHILSLITMQLKSIELTQSLTSISRRAFNKSRQLQEKFDDLGLGDNSDVVSDEQRQFLRECRLAAQCDSAIYLKGEEGTDKEEQAEYIHRISNFGKGTMMIFDCDNVPDTNQTALLFGTYAGSDKKGYFDKCSNGTLYITAAHELVPESQRILQEILELGNDKKGRGEARIIVSGDLEKAVADGDFDSSLFDLIAEMTTEIPALRNCREDLPGLCQKQLKELSRKLKLPVPKIGKKFLQFVLSSNWHGNHRELRSFLEKSLICTTGRELQIPESAVDTGGAAIMRTADSFDSNIKRSIKDALKKTRGKVYGTDGAAALLGLNPSTLQSKMRKFGIKKK